jgi:hypothetical protein
MAPYLAEEPGKQPELSFGMRLKKYSLMATVIPKVLMKFRAATQDASTKDVSGAIALRLWRPFPFPFNIIQYNTLSHSYFNSTVESF